VIGGLIRRVAGPKMLSAIAGPVSSLLLTRLLLPAEYGLIGATSAIVAVAAMLAELRLAGSLLPRAELPQRAVDTSFWTTVSLHSAVLAGLVIFAAPLANAMGVPDITPLIPLAAGALLPNAVSAVPIALLRRDLRLGTLAWIETASVVVGGSLSVLLAWQGFGAVSPLVGPLVGRSLRMALVLFVGRARLGVDLDFAEIATQLRYGLPLLLSGVIGAAASNVDRAVLARAFPLEELGFYDRGLMLALLPANIVAGIVGAIGFPVLAKAVREGRDAASGFASALNLGLALALPAGAVIAFLVAPSVPLILGEKWELAAPVVAIATPLAMATIFGQLAHQAYAASGRTERWLIYIAVKSAVLLPTLLFFASHGARWAAAGQSLVACVFVGANCWWGYRTLGGQGAPALRVWHAATPLAFVGAGVVVALLGPWPGAAAGAAACALHVGLVRLTDKPSWDGIARQVSDVLSRRARREERSADR
jgi:PST family polysaccharide transporter